MAACPSAVDYDAPGRLFMSTGYYSNCLEKPSPNPLVEDEEVCRRMREVSLELLREHHVLEAA